MKREFSAGGIVFKREGREKNAKDAKKIRWLVVQHSQHKGWVFPKGLIGDALQKLNSKNQKEETKEEAALREVKEEGGVEAKIISEIKPPVSYWYVFKGEKILKTVYFYLMQYLSGDIGDHDLEVSDAKWLKKEEVKKTLTYHNDKRAFEGALKLFKRS